MEGAGEGVMVVGIFLDPSGLRLRPGHGKTPSVPAPANEEQRGAPPIELSWVEKPFSSRGGEHGPRGICSELTQDSACSPLSVTPAHLPEDESAQVDFRKAAE